MPGGRYEGDKMKRLRFRMVLLACWLVLFYSIERISGKVDISDVAYLLVLAMVLVIFLTPQLPKVSLGSILALSLTFFFLLRAGLGTYQKPLCQAWWLWKSWPWWSRLCLPTGWAKR